jgi:microcystin-dependent protein
VIGDEFYIGQVIYTAFTFPHKGWMKCEGQLLLIKDYPALFALLGTRYGGDGTSTFSLPDLRDRGAWPANKPVAQICVDGIFPCRD